MTDRTQCRRSLGDVIRAAVDGGATAVVLQEADLPRVKRMQLADELRSILEPVRGTLIVASDLTILAEGVHLTADDKAPDRLFEGIVGRSCHDIEELMQSFVDGMDYVTLSPIFLTASGRRDEEPIGLTELSRFARSIPLSMYALGGVTQANAEACMFAGAAGIAVMGEIMRSARPDQIVSNLLAAFMMRS